MTSGAKPSPVSASSGARSARVSSRDGGGMVVLWTGYWYIAKIVVCTAILAMRRAASAFVWVSIWFISSSGCFGRSSLIVLCTGGGRWGRGGGLLRLVSSKYQASAVKSSSSQAGCPPPHLFSRHPYGYNAHHAHKPGHSCCDGAVRR